MPDKDKITADEFKEAKEKSSQETLAEIMLRREVRLAAKEEAEQHALDTKNAQREFNAKHHNDARLLAQIRCKHLKGGKSGPRSQVRDFAVYHHTYINGEEVVRCFICAMKWKKEDTQEFLVRDGRKIANHTKLGWQDAQMMLTQTTNQPSSSEVPLREAAITEPLPAYEAQ